MQYGPDPSSIYPNENIKSICYIKNLITRRCSFVGDCTCYDEINGAEQFEEQARHHYVFMGYKLTIGKFCALAGGIGFRMNGATHRMRTLTTYPFNSMGLR